MTYTCHYSHQPGPISALCARKKTLFRQKNALDFSGKEDIKQSGSRMSFPRCKHQISFVSDQLLPTILGAILPDAACSCVHGLVTPHMRNNSRILGEALQNRGRQYKEHLLPHTGQEDIFQRLNAVRDTCQGEPLALNLTCGTKLMTLAAAEWASCEVPTFYMDTGTETIVLPSQQWDSLPMPDLLDVHDLLASGGYRVKNATEAPVPEHRRAQLHEILKLLCNGDVHEARQALGGLNGCAQGAATNPERIAEDRVKPTPTWRRLRQLCRDAAMLEYDKGHVHFPSEEARQWCNGRWFEEFVRMILYKMRQEKQITSWAASVEVEKNGVPNELDALFSVRNRLFVIECKTASLSDSSKATNVLYKADALHSKLGGSFAKSAICSVLPLKQGELERARGSNIHVLHGNALLRLQEKLAAWTSPARHP